MQPINKLMLAVAVVWVLFTVYGVLMLLPFMDQRMRNFEMKLKHSKVPLSVPNRAQRIVFLVLTCLMMAVSFASAWHHDLSEMIGVNSGTPVILMIILPLLYFALGWRKKRLPEGETPKQ